MNIEELRNKWGGMLPQVGDWVLTPDKTEYFLALAKGLNFSDVCENWHPIPLTKEVWSKIKNENILLAPDIDVQLGSSNISIFSYDSYGEDTPQKQIKYLHQLQQLCRFFRGKELNYNP